MPAPAAQLPAPRRRQEHVQVSWYTVIGKEFFCVERLRVFFIEATHAKA
ncbi:hypothetical protein HMPREF9248_1202 [Fannyhessea vaginae PB189-T1-4]|uniref:Uncharacterized protein n=1 Tax=Fannyhessea vaginae PB189-T1-4 TaxID=866774 RepID=A0ABP2J618_9ACTN|nr:hypothetical protein HMPREF9248_1202 [Fannyhessea vaginae PB189-T1-4]